MQGFIKLTTTDGCSVHLNIASVDEIASLSKSVILGDMTAHQKGARSQVTMGAVTHRFRETPDEILALIEGRPSTEEFCAALAEAHEEALVKGFIHLKRQDGTAAKLRARSALTYPDGSHAKQLIHVVLWDLGLVSLLEDTDPARTTEPG